MVALYIQLYQKQDNTMQQASYMVVSWFVRLLAAKRSKTMAVLSTLEAQGTIAKAAPEVATGMARNRQLTEIALVFTVLSVL